MKMPFGKHKGKEVADLPLDYLHWLIQYAELTPKLQQEVDAAIEMHNQAGGSDGIAQTLYVCNQLLANQSPDYLVSFQLGQIQHLLAYADTTISQLISRLQQLESEKHELQKLVVEVKAALDKSLSFDVLSYEDLQKLYRHYSRRYHPDRGGNDVAMRVVNEIFTSLRKVFEGE